MSDHRKHLTLLHSNDLHGDFLAEKLDDRLVGGVSMLSGYVNRTREENPNTLYMVAGDMFRGSLIDTEFQGISTIEIMNALGPDAATLGNHELDYGIAHLLFLERCCKFPIVNANIYIRTNRMRLFRSHQILQVDGMKILVIGVISEEIMGGARQDRLLGSFVDLADAAEEVGVIINSYKTEDVDLTVLLTHIGFENDVLLARQLDPELGVDIIIGGHSHTLSEHPTEENGILIVQAGVGTDQIGRFEIDIDTDRNAVADYTWKTVPIDGSHCPRNEALEEMILNYKKITDAKYGEILITLPRQLTHPSRYQETAVGNLFADAAADQFRLDLVLIASGSLRLETFGPIVTLGGLLDMHPFDEKLWRFLLTGAEIKHAVLNYMRNAPTDDDTHAEYYQINRGWRFSYRRGEDSLAEATYNGRPVPDDALFRVAACTYHFNNMQKPEFLDLDEERIFAREKPRVISSNFRSAVEEYLRTHAHLDAQVEGRTRFL